MQQFVGHQKIKQVFSWLFLLAALTLFLYSAGFLYRFVDLAPELSDSGFYLIMRFSAEEVFNTLTVFGVLTKSFLGELSVIKTRLTHFLLLFFLDL